MQSLENFSVWEQSAWIEVKSSACSRQPIGKAGGGHTASMRRFLQDGESVLIESNFYYHPAAGK